MGHAKATIRRATADGAPWFLYFADLHPHTTLFNHPRFGPGPPGPFDSSNGQYGQVMRELDWAVGELLLLLEELDQAADTLVVFTSDNGPYQEEGWNDAGRKGGLTGGKGQIWEGGIRVPAIVRWPGVVPAGAESSAPVRGLDLLPTFAAFAGAQLPRSLVVDGQDQSDFFMRPMDMNNPWLAQRRTQFHYCGTNIIAARWMDFKVFWATQKWQEGWGAVCHECCPRAGYTAGLFGSTTLCQCDAKSLDYHSPPLVFNIRRDPNETKALRFGTFDHSRAVLAVERVRPPRSGPPPPTPCLARPPHAYRAAAGPRTAAPTRPASTPPCPASTARCRSPSARGRAVMARCRSATRMVARSRRAWAPRALSPPFQKASTAVACPAAASATAVRVQVTAARAGASDAMASVRSLPPASIL